MHVQGISLIAKPTQKLGYRTDATCAWLRLVGDRSPIQGWSRGPADLDIFQISADRKEINQRLAGPGR